MPICNENVARLFAGLEASPAATSELRHFDFYVFSDTSDPETQVEEEVARAQTCRSVQGFGEIFYRHRRNNIKRKSGNIADFLRRWGRYPFRSIRAASVWAAPSSDGDCS
jgi:membrane glycosyltransferase